MALITKPFTFSTGATIVASEHNSNFDTAYNVINGNLENANIGASAAIADTKLAQITTPSKVSGAALTTLTSVPSGAGRLPAANVPNEYSTAVTFNTLPTLPTTASSDDDAASKAYVDTTTATASIAGVFDFADSTSASTSAALSSVYVCYGRTPSLAADATHVVTNLPYTNTNNYTAVATYNVTADRTDCATVTRDSKKQITVRNGSTTSTVINWLTVGR